MEGAPAVEGMTTLLIVDDHEVFRQGLRAVLEQHAGFSVVGEAANRLEALERAAALRPDVILMGVNVLTQDWLQAVALIKQRTPETKVLVLSVSDYEPEMVYEAIKAGAIGYLTKTAGVDDLVVAIRAVVRGDVVVASPASPALTKLLAFIGQTSRAPAALAQPTECLSAREKEVLELVGEGLTNRDIAERLSISENTVNSHVRSILGKLNLVNRVQAATYFARNKQAGPKV